MCRKIQVNFKVVFSWGRAQFQSRARHRRKVMATPWSVQIDTIVVVAVDVVVVAVAGVAP